MLYQVSFFLRTKLSNLGQTQAFFINQNINLPTFPDLSAVIPLHHAHAHNDGKNKRPLFDALSQGFCFIEADIHLIRNEIYVAHRRPIFPRRDKTLSRLYLEPLFQLFQQQGQIFPQDNCPIYLLLDIKSNAAKTYERLKKTILPYQTMLSSWENNVEKRGVVRLILSGNRPIDRVVKESKRWFLLDGRIEDIGKKYPVELMPMISDRFAKVLGRHYFGKTLSAEQEKRLRVIAHQVHREGKKLRLWNSPEKESIWAALLEGGADIINTDQLFQVATFFKNRRVKSAQKKA